MILRFFLLPGVLALSTAAAAPAQPPLSQFAPVTEGLIAVGMALELSETCPQIDARQLRGLFYLNALKRQAQEAGYSSAQIDAFVEDDAQKAALEAEARARLAALGAVPGDTASHCRVARAEIQRGSDAGRLLRD